MPKINYVFFLIEGFKYAISLSLNMVNYNIHISEDTSDLIKIIVPWGNTITRF